MQRKAASHVTQADGKVEELDKPEIKTESTGEEHERNVGYHTQIKPQLRS